MNKIQKYEYVRNLPEEQFKVLKNVFNMGHFGTFESITKVVKTAIAGLLAYIAYDQFDANTALSIMAGVSAFLVCFNKKCSGFIPALIAANKLSNNEALRVKYAEIMNNMIADIKIRRIKALDKALKDLDKK